MPKLSETLGPAAASLAEMESSPFRQTLRDLAADAVLPPARDNSFSDGPDFSMSVSEVAQALERMRQVTDSSRNHFRDSYEEAAYRVNRAVRGEQPPWAQAQRVRPWRYDHPAQGYLPPVTAESVREAESRSLLWRMDFSDGITVQLTLDRDGASTLMAVIAWGDGGSAASRFPSMRWRWVGRLDRYDSPPANPASLTPDDPSHGVLNVDVPYMQLVSRLGRLPNQYNMGVSDVVLLFLYREIMSAYHRLVRTASGVERPAASVEPAASAVVSPGAIISRRVRIPREQPGDSPVSTT